jgi:hypothetical protein
MKLDYFLTRNEGDECTELQLRGFDGGTYFVAVFYDDGTFTRIRSISPQAGLQLDNEERIIEEIAAGQTVPTIRIRK